MWPHTKGVHDIVWPHFDTSIFNKQNGEKKNPELMNLKTKKKERKSERLLQALGVNC